MRGNQARRVTNCTNAVALITPTPYYDLSGAMNSDNNGPYEDALMTELIPYIEEHLRIIREPDGRMLVGKSSGAERIVVRTPGRTFIISPGNRFKARYFHTVSGSMPAFRCCNPLILQGIRQLP
jgi:hypothetical protein